jgi:cytochrome oxidase Cu insertion factor (SCO1/SenC/PrrC family)
MIAVLLVCAAPVIASYFMYYVVRPQTRTNYGELVEPSALPADLALRDAAGRSVPPASLKQQWLLIAVGPGACDAACEKHLYWQRQIRETLGRDKDRLDRVWLIDDGEPMRPALAAAMQGATVLRADRAALAAWLKPATGHALEEHFYLVDPQGHWMMRFPAQADARKVQKDLMRLLRASNSWDKAGRP